MAAVAPVAAIAAIASRPYRTIPDASPPITAAVASRAAHCRARRWCPSSAARADAASSVATAPQPSPRTKSRVAPSRASVSAPHAAARARRARSSPGVRARGRVGGLERGRRQVGDGAERAELGRVLRRGAAQRHRGRLPHATVQGRQHEAQPRVGVHGGRGERRPGPAQRLAVAGEEQRHGPAADQPGQERVVTGRPGVLEGLRGEIVRRGPLGRPDVQPGPVGRPPVELAVEPRAQQRRHRDVPVAGIDGHERGLALEPLEGRDGVVAPGELGGERRRDGGRHAEVLEERPVALGEPAQDLVAQVGRGRALAPRERGEEAGHLDGSSGGGRDEAEPGGPPAGQGVRPLHLARRHPGPAPREERRHLRDGEAQAVAGQVDDATLQSQAGQGRRRRGPPGQDQAEAGRPVADHRLELVEHRGVGELLDVVEDEPDLDREHVEHGEHDARWSAARRGRA